MEKNNKFDENTNWEEIIKLIEEKQFSKSYPDYKYKLKEKGYLIYNKKKNIYLFNKKKEIKIFFDDNNLPETLEISSSLEIENKIIKKGKDIDNLYLKGENIKYSSILTSLELYIDEYEFEIREKKKLDKLVFVNNLNEKEDYTPNEYSKFFQKYFIHDNISENNKKIIYQNSNTRKKIFANLKLLKWKDLKSFKFTGPHSNGKSFTLLRFSRIYFDVAYINLKVLNEYKNDLYLSYNIIIHELERFNIQKNLEELEDLIIKNYEGNVSYLKLILNIMEFLNKLEQKFIFIFDQFKLKYIDVDFMNKIKNFNNIKIVQCSSINDKNIREECIKTWSLKGINITDLNEDIQDYYLYYSKIYIIDKNNYKQKNETLRQFAYMPKYVNKYQKDFNGDKQFLDEEKKNILNKIGEFCNSEGIEKSYLLTSLKNIVGKEFNYSLFSNIIQYCPLKYFIIYFKEYYFKIKPIFPFLINIINYQIEEKECDDFFTNKKYKNNNILSDFVKGDYFEASAKFALMKFKLPQNEKSINVTLEEIVSMDKIIKPDDYILDEEYIEDKDEENNPILINNITNIKGIKNISDSMKEIKLDNESNNKDNKIEDKDNGEEEEKNDIESNQYEDVIMKDETNQEESIEINEGKNDENNSLRVQNFYLNALLKKFNVNNEREIFDSIGLSSEAIAYSKNIEDYRFDEIDIQNQKEKMIENNNNYKGDESIFLNQFNKRGKTLDFAYLYGNKNEKTFIGFQMKCYFDKSDLSNDVVDKCKIRKDCQKILVNSMKLFNCKITKWCYYLVFYYNSQDQDENTKQTNLTKCERNNVSYFLYEPIEKNFYCVCEGVKIRMSELDIETNANLDSCVINAISFSKNIFDELKIQIGKKEIIEMKQSFINDFDKGESKCKEQNKIYFLLRDIRQKLELGNYELTLHARFKFSNNYFFPPDADYILLYKKKSSKSFIASYIKDKVNKFFDLSTKKELKTIFDCLDVECDYYYCLKKKKKHKKIKNNELLPKQKRDNLNMKKPNFSNDIYLKNELY